LATKTLEELAKASEEAANASREAIVVQLQDQMSTRTNIILASNSFLFLPFVSSLTGATALAGLFLWIPIVICVVSIVLNIFWVHSIFSQIRKRDNFVEKSSLPTRFFSAPKIKEKTLPDESTFYDFFNKYTPFLMIAAWICILALYVLQKSALL